jgi:hypothetical protein
MSQELRLSGALALFLGESLLVRGDAFSRTEGQIGTPSRNRRTVAGFGGVVQRNSGEVSSDLKKQFRSEDKKAPQRGLS